MDHYAISIIPPELNLTPYGVDREVGPPINNREVGPPSLADKCGLSIQIFSGGKFIVANSADLFGTALLANRIPAGTIPIIGIPAGAIPIIVGGALSFGAMYMFFIGYSLRNDNAVSKNTLMTFCAYTSGIASLGETVGTLIAIKPEGVQLGRGLLIGASVFSSMAFLATLGDIALSPGYSEYVDQSTNQNESTVIPEQRTFGHYVCKRVQQLGIALFSLAGLGDPIGSTFTNFSPNLPGNFTSPEDNTGKWIITGSCILGGIGLMLYTGAYFAEQRLAPKK